MPLRFVKMHGLANDFMVIDTTQEPWPLSPALIQKMGNRHTGIGFDQLLAIESPKETDHDFFYRIFNVDGSEVGQCGNGARCIGHYLFTRFPSSKDKYVLKTISGRLEVEKANNGLIKVNMGVPQFLPAKIPFITDNEAPLYELILNGKPYQFGAVALGNPHAVFRVDNILSAPVEPIGQLLQQHPAFPKKVNVGFMEILSQDHIRLRVFERGVGETQACGSGACAAMVIGRHCYELSSQVKVELVGGPLLIHWEAQGKEVYMIGPAEIVFEGELVAEMIAT